jgi:hypothetical protein
MKLLQYLANCKGYVPDKDLSGPVANYGSAELQLQLTLIKA